MPILLEWLKNTRGVIKSLINGLKALRRVSDRLFHRGTSIAVDTASASVKIKLHGENPDATVKVREDGSISAVEIKTDAKQVKIEKLEAQEVQEKESRS